MDANHLANLIQNIGQLARAIQQQNNYISRREMNIIKIKHFYEESQDLISQLEDFEKAANANGISDARKLQVVPAYLKGAAAIWYSDRQADQNTNTQIWRALNNANAQQIAHSFRQPFINHFKTESKISSWQRELKAHTQMPTDSIEKYAIKLRELLRRIDPENHLEERYRVSYFIKGLQPTYKFHVIIHQPATLEEAINSAKQYEDGCQQVAQQINLFNPFVQPAQNDELSQLKSQLDSLKKQLKDQQRNSQQPPRMNRSPAQPKCYSCGRTGHLAANCRSTARPAPLSR